VKIKKKINLENKKEIRYVLKFYYKKKKNAIQAAEKIGDVYRHNAVSVRGTKLI